MDTANKTINQLEGIQLPEPSKNSSGLIQKIYWSRDKPISELDAEDLRILISQRQGLDFVLPKALNLLKSNPFTCGDYYDGDLLEVVLNEASYIRNSNPLHELFKVVINEAIKNIARVDLADKHKNDLLMKLSAFI